MISHTVTEKDNTVGNSAHIYFIIEHSAAIFEITAVAS